MLVDSHCHLDRLDLAPNDGSFARLHAEITEQGIEHMLCVSIDLESLPAMLALVEQCSGVSASVGVHPNEVGCLEPTAEQLAKLSEHPRVVAIGETGLDFYRTEGDQKWQKDRFRTHIAAAKESRKPLIIHTRDSAEQTLAILKEERADEVGGVFHCFTESWEIARQALDLNFYISFSGIVTFRSAVTIQDVAKKVPQDRILVETDSPYLAPHPHRGKPNYPYYLPVTAKYIAYLRNQETELVAEYTTENFFRLFPLAAAI